jgi:hypothetical protein
LAYPPIIHCQLPIEPYETKPRIQRLINDLASYKRLAATIPAAQVHALKKKVRNGDIKECAALWGSRNRECCGGSSVSVSIWS